MKPSNLLLLLLLLFYKLSLKNPPAPCLNYFTISYKRGLLL